MNHGILCGLRSVSLAILGLIFWGDARAQEHHLQKYYPPTDTLVQQKLAAWGDMKFGLLMHWGPYSQWGIVESWSICPEDEGWCERRGTYAQNYFEYKKAYEGLQNTFNPVNFNPEKWASAARAAGMKYQAPRWVCHVRYQILGLQDYLAQYSVSYQSKGQHRQGSV
jgi:alpha-L-fucosidase